MKNTLFIGLLFTLSFFPVCVEAENVTAYVIPAITDNKILPASSIPSSYISDTISIRASPGEFEPASFVIHANEAISPITVKITNLTGTGCIIPNTNVDIRIVKCWYQGGYNNQEVTLQGRYLTPELLLKDDSLIKVTGENWTSSSTSNLNGNNYLKLTSGQYANISESTLQNLTLVTPISKFPVRDSTTLQPVTIPKGYNKQFWVTIKVPRNTSSGNYSGNIIIESNMSIIQELKLNLQVLPIELSNTNIEYSIFYRGKITEYGSISSENKTVEQFTAELQDMYNHGITNPTIYPYIGSYSLLLAHETSICQELEARQNAGIDNTNLYFCGYIAPGNIPHFKNSFAQYGVKELYQYGPDEQDLNTTERRDVITAEHNAGGKHFCAEWNKSYAESVPDILDLVITGNVWFDVADSYHSYGHKIFLYNRPQAVPEYPRTFRLNYGLLLWQNGYDGAMDYAYQHSFGNIWNDFDKNIRDHVFAYPTVDGVIDTVQWEGFREGVDDVRYLTTLQNTIALAKSQGKNTSEAENYLTNLKDSSLSSMDLDAVRGQMINYTLSLQNELNLTNDNTTGNDSIIEINCWGSPRIGTAPLTVYFKDNSTGSPTAWNWSFGDGTYSTLQNPKHTYSAAGNYTVKLTVTNSAGSASVAKCNYITVTGTSVPTPVAGFSSNVTSGSSPLSVSFADTSTGAPTSWNWNFGDGTSSTVKNPVHMYSKAGNYIVSLTVSNDAGSNTTIEADYIKVIEPVQKPVASFNSNVTSGKAPLEVAFTDTSTGLPTAWNWDFGDGANSTDQSPEHTYLAAGSYTVNLTVSNANGTDSKLATITVGSRNTVVVSFNPLSTDLHPGSSQNIQIVMDGVPTGLAGFNFTISISDSEIVEITAVTFPSWLQLPINSTLPSSSVWMNGVDLTDQVAQGNTNVFLGNITLTGKKAGKTDINIVPTAIDDDNGDPINPDVVSGIVEVVLPVFPGYTNPPTDLNNDGLYEDINGNGCLEFDDVVAYHVNMDWIGQNGLTAYFDYNHNSRIDFNDVVKLCKMLMEI